MKYDKRIINPFKNICTPFDVTSDADNWIGTKGYFTNFLENFHNLDECNYGTLKSVKHTEDDEYEDMPYRGCIETTGEEDFYSYFLFARDVKTEENKYRPFTVKEFIDKFPLMSPVIIRNKPDGEILVRCVTGYSKTHSRVYFGRGYNLDVLFDNCEYQDAHGNWLPFGVEE